MNKTNNRTHNIVAFLIEQGLALFFAQILIRFYGFYFVYRLHSEFIIDFWDLIIGLGLDLLLTAGLLLPAYIILRLSPNFFKVSSFNFIRLLFFLLIVASFILESYFCVQLAPLGNVLLSYNLNDLIEISSNSSGIGIIEYLIFAGIIFTFIWWSYKGKFVYQIKQNQFFVGSLLSIILSFGAINYVSNLGDIFSYFTSINKPYYLLEDVWLSSKQYEHKDDSLSKKDIATYQYLMQSRDFTEPKYPMQYIADSTDVLGAFMQIKDKPPNLVFILVETLSRTISGPNALHDSYTPFLDSLAQKSLYWENYTSASERTIGVLPSVLGSLPLGNNGFMNMKGKMPNHNSLISLLKYNGYTSRYFYGGRINFDNSNSFLAEQQVDLIQSSGFYSNNGVSYWGISDSLVFSKSILALKDSKRQPFINIYLTLSTHGPYDNDVFKYYDQYFEDYLKNSISTDLQQYGVDNKKKLLAYLYTDFQINKLINDYKELGIYDNTIFIITGDHGLFSMDRTNVLQKYHVPLIIHSSLAKRNCSFKGFASHYDIAPTICSFLKNNYHLNLPNEVHWIGNVIDTSKTFCGANNFVPILDINRNITDFVYHNTFYTKGKAYSISDKLVIAKSNIQNVDTLEEYLEAYRRIDSYVTKNNKLVNNSYSNIFDRSKLLVKEFSRSKWPISERETFTTIEKFNTNTENSSYEFDISFDFFTDETSIKKHPIIMVDLYSEKLNKTLESYSIELTDRNYNESNTKVDISIKTRVSQDIEGTPISIDVYLWNPQNITYNITNLEYKRYRLIAK